MGKLWQLPAREAVALLRRGEATPLEVLDAAIGRIQAVELKVNALPTRFFDAARAQARDAA